MMTDNLTMKAKIWYPKRRRTKGANEAAAVRAGNLIRAEDGDQQGAARKPAAEIGAKVVASPAVVRLEDRAARMHLY
jgi:hypothetical protein